MRSELGLRSSVARGLKDKSLKDVNDIFKFIAQEIKSKVSEEIISGKLTTEEEIAYRVLICYTEALDIFKWEPFANIVVELENLVDTYTLYDLLKTKEGIA